ncbi:Solute carrier family 22 member 3 [Holothuria leucospilota]|uniref:Solute carrier family 22 member 3 n=1 Tax=Holothuria leucospilota TaxID=206669 RepID=A0A9Q1CHQ6_HOLLE|nr:Solute carrier family 22 member 3 [Holothuria leucospilota]
MQGAGMKVDEALHLAKPLGRVQFFILVCNCSLSFCASWIYLGSVFFSEAISYKCKTAPEKDVLIGNLSIKEFQSFYCHDGTSQCFGKLDYDTSEHGQSIVTEWDLVCDRASLASVSLSVLHAGLAVGSITFGYTTDKYGRRSMMLFCLVLFNIFSLAETLSPNFIFFVIMRFLCGLTFKGAWLSPTTMMFEYLTPNYRSVIGSIPQIFFSVGLIVMSGVGYLVKDWRPFRAVLMTPTLICLSFFWMLPESVRWQLSKNKVREAERTIQKVAKWNGVMDFPKLVFTDTVLVESIEEGQQRAKATNNNSSFFEIIKPPTVVVTVALGVMWFTFFSVYFGFALSSGSLAGNLYFNFFLNSLVEIPARLLQILVVGRVSRVASSFVCFFGAGLTMTAIVFLRNIDGEWSTAIPVLAFLGKFLITFIFATVLLMTTEVFPTTIRVAGTGFVQACGSIGSISAPLLLYLDTILPNLAFTCLAGIAFLAAFLCCLLPETRNTVQPQTVEDLRELLKNRYISIKTFFNTRRLRRNNWHESRESGEDPSSDGEHDSREVGRSEK